MLHSQFNRTVHARMHSRTHAHTHNILFCVVFAFLMTQLSRRCRAALAVTRGLPPGGHHSCSPGHPTTERQTKDLDSCSRNCWRIYFVTTTGAAPMAGK